MRAEEALERSLKVEIDGMAKDAERLNDLVARAQAAVDKRQNMIEIRQQQLAELGGDHSFICTAHKYYFYQRR